MPNSQQNVTNIPSNRVDFIDKRTGLVSREWYRFFVNLFNLAGAGGNQVSLDDLQIGPPPQPVSEGGGGGGSGTVTSVDMTVPTGLSVAGNPITTAGTLAVTYASGYAIPTTAKQTEWDTAYTDRLKWDGGATDLVAATGRTSLGATTVGGNFFTLPDPSAITFVQINADNTITTMDAPTFRTAIGAGTGAGSVTSVGTAGTVNGLTLTGGPITSSGTVTLGGTLDLSSPPAIGGTTPAAGTFTTLIGGGGSANYGQVTGGATTKAVEFKTLGSDTNVTYTIRTKGTGAIDLAAGSSGVNISNGGTVTAITRTSAGASYTSIPSVAITAPTTAGGVQATASITAMLAGNPTTIQAGGTGYTVNDTLTVVGGTPTGTAATYTVTAVSGGVVTAVTALNFASYSALPTNPVSVTGGTGSGCILNLTYGVASGQPTITNAGSGYVEQPTVTFSGGGGSGAAAYATVGSVTTIKSIGSSTTGVTTASLQFYTPNTLAPVLTLRDIGGADTGVLVSPAAGYTNITAFGAANATLMLASAGTNPIHFNTQGTSQTNQMRVVHTASAVNYVQVTGAATSASASSLGGLSFTGSDANPNFAIGTKGTGYIAFYGGAATNIQAFRVNTTSAASTGNLIQVQGAASGSAPSIQAISGSSGSDTNIDLALTPKGTGVVRTSGTGLRLSGSSSGYVGLKGAAAAGSTTYTLPAADGTSGQVLSTDGAATLSWATPSGGSSNITAQGMWENALTISSNYTITSGNSAMSAGPITIASGVSVTVPSGSRWVVV